MNGDIHSLGIGGNHLEFALVAEEIVFADPLDKSVAL